MYIQRSVILSEAETLRSGLSVLRVVISFLHDTVVAHLVVKTVRGKTDFWHHLQGLCFFLFFHVPRLSVGNPGHDLGLPWAPAWHGAALVPVSQIWRGPVAVAWGGLQVGYQ